MKQFKSPANFWGGVRAKTKLVIRAAPAFFSKAAILSSVSPCCHDIVDDSVDAVVNQVPVGFNNPEGVTDVLFSFFKRNSRLFFRFPDSFNQIENEIGFQGTGKCFGYFQRLVETLFRSVVVFPRGTAMRKSGQTGRLFFPIALTISFPIMGAMVKLAWNFSKWTSWSNGGS